MPHQPVLLEECLRALNPQPGGYYVDGTFGRGGHSRALLARLDADSRLLGLDQDPQAVHEGERLAQAEPRFQMRHSSFAGLEQQLHALGWMGHVQGILLDLGVSSPQLDEAERGFSFQQDGPLDMRMNPEEGESAAHWLATAKEKTIADVLFRYGDERYSRRIARALVKARQETPLTRTRQLAELVAAAHPRWEPHKHPATRSFQAIRIFINQELEALEAVLPQALEALAPGGRLAIISFHSLEDRLVKRFIRDQAKGDDFPPDLPIPDSALKRRLKPIGKAIHPGTAETDTNPRARSAVLRVAEKLV